MGGNAINCGFGTGQAQAIFTFQAIYTTLVRAKPAGIGKLAQSHHAKPAKPAIFSCLASSCYILIDKFDDLCLGSLAQVYEIYAHARI